MKRLLYILCQSTWGFVQTLIGAIIFLICPKKQKLIYHGAVVAEWKLKGSLSLGMFIFLSDSMSEERKRRVLVHEYGHTIQSLILGPLYLIVIGLPSCIWAGFPPCEKYRRRRNRSYYWLYPERWANLLGERITGEEPEK